MITQKPNYSSLKQSENFKAVKFGIKKEGLAHIFNVLRNQLYTDKILAVIREYSCNAVDAHIEAGKDEEPIIVTLPNRMNPNFKVRDYGFGLSEQDIRDVYANYGESTKRNTNSQIGQLGLGCKSAFAYGDNFVINTYQNGVKTSYNAFIDPSQIGQISRMNREKTTEADGIEIVVPTKGDDHDAFAEKAESLFRNFKVYPTIRGADIKPFNFSVVIEGEGWEIIKSEYSHRGYGHYHSQDEAVAIMGNIPYPMQSRSIDWQKLEGEKGKSDGDLKAILESNIRIDFEIGDLEIAASREGLQYTEYTQKQVIERLEKIKVEIVKTVTDKLDNSPSMYEAKKIYGQVFDYGSVLYSLRHLFGKSIQFKGKPVDSEHFQCGHTEGVTFKLYKKSPRGFRVRPEEAYRIECDDDKPIVINDIDLQGGILNRVAPLIECDPNHIGRQVKEVVVINPHDMTKYRAWKKSKSFDAPLIKLSDLPKVKLADIYGTTSNSGNGNSTYGKNAKHSTKVFTYDWDCESNSWAKKSDWWNTASVDLKNDQGHYIILDKFLYLDGEIGESGATGQPRYLKNVKETLEALKIKVPKNLYGLKIKMFEDGKNPCGDGMVNFFSYIKEELKNKIKSLGIEQRFRDRELAKSVESADKMSWLKHLTEIKFDEKLADQDGTMATFMKAYKEMLHEADAKTIETIRQAAKEYKIKLKDVDKLKGTHNLTKMSSEVSKKYSMLQHLDSYIFGWRWEEHKSGSTTTDIENYINVVDICGTN
jgi:hypothetical protein